MGPFRVLVLTYLCACGLFAQQTRLTSRPLRAEYSKSLDKIIMLSASPDQLHIYDPVTKADTAVALSRTPLSLSVSLDGKYAAVGHDSLLTYINLSTGSVEKR